MNCSIKGMIDTSTRSAWWLSFLIKMCKCKGCGKLGKMVPRDVFVSAYHFTFLLSPVVSVWDCIVRKMRYSYRPEWV